MMLSDTLGRADPVPRLLDSTEPAARLIALTMLSGEAPEPAVVAAAHEDVLRDSGTQTLLALLPDWEAGDPIAGHDRPFMATNLLDLLFEMGLRAGDDPRIDHLLDQMLEHTDEDGRFQMCVAQRGAEAPRWGALLCDTHAVLDMLLAYGRGEDPRIRRALDTSLSDLQATEQGPAWPCRPSTGTTWRGPGRVRDCCPQTSLEALRAFSRLPRDARPATVMEAARSVLGVWRARATQKPYMFGHGRQFKRVKWPPTWYGAYEFVDTLGRLPEVWSGPAARPEDRASLCEVAACLLAYNVALDGTVTPVSTFKGFETFSFGQKRRPSPLATALVWAALARLGSLADQIAAVDVTALASSKGGAGAPLPPAIA